MADKKINELPVSSGLTDDALLPVYQNDQTQSITGALVKTFAAAAAQEYVGTAQQAAQAAEKSARQAAESIGQLGDAVERAQAARAGAEAAEQGAEAARTAIEDMRVAAVALSGSQSATVEKTTEEGVVKLTFGLPAGPAGADGAQGPQGVGITGIERTAGTGAPGTADTYTITLSNGASAAFTVYNGANGAGSGDFMASGSVAMTGELRMDGHRVTGVGAPQEDGDAVRRADLTAGNVKFTDGETFQQKYDAGQLSGADGKSAYQAAADKGYTGTEEAFNAALAGMKDGPFLPLKGGTMTGELEMENNLLSLGGKDGGIHFEVARTNPSGDTVPRLTLLGNFGDEPCLIEVAAPESKYDAANKEYVDSAVSSGGGGKRVTRRTVGTVAAGWTAKDCDYLCDGTDDQEEINQAISSLPPAGGEVVILDGTYNITATIGMHRDNVRLSGNGTATVLKRMWDNSDLEGVISITAVNGKCTVANLQVDGNGASYTGRNNNGIYLSSSENIITGNTFTNSNYYGIYLSGSGNTVTGNIFSSNGRCGIYLSSSENSTISGNTFINNSSTGIYLNSSHNNTVTGNTFNNNSYGIYVSSSNSNTITGNTCNNDGIGIWLVSSKSNTIVGNTCIRGTGQNSDYAFSQYTIYLNGTGNNSNLIAYNNIMGKNYTSGGGTGNTFMGNKYN